VCYHLHWQALTKVDQTTTALISRSRHLKRQALGHLLREVLRHRIRFIATFALPYFKENGDKGTAGVIEDRNTVSTPRNIFAWPPVAMLFSRGAMPGSSISDRSIQNSSRAARNSTVGNVQKPSGDRRWCRKFRVHIQITSYPRAVFPSLMRVATLLYTIAIAFSCLHQFFLLPLVLPSPFPNLKIAFVAYSPVCGFGDLTGSFANLFSKKKNF
jgi:hypothetical protein